MSGGPVGEETACPVVRDATGAWVLRRHEDVLAAALDPQRFSSRVSRHLNIPNGMDGEQHARYRKLVERYMSPERTDRLEGRFREIARELVDSLPRDRPLDAVSGVGSRFAVRAQSAWLGWPADAEESLIEWMDENRAAARSSSLEMSKAVADRFDRIIRALVEARRDPAGCPDTDVTAELIAARIDGRPLTVGEIVSILRNWTAGDLGTIAACIGVVIRRLTTDPALQDRWRDHRPEAADMNREIDELLRIDDPFTVSRRVTTCPVSFGDQAIPAGARIRLDWAEANRDPEVVGDPEAFRPVENAGHNLVYGIGPHVCPGRGLATLEIRVVVEELLARISLEPDPELEPVRAEAPQGGFESVPVRLRELA